jgi:hypothetical protein
MRAAEVKATSLTLCDFDLFGAPLWNSSVPGPLVETTLLQPRSRIFVRTDRSSLQKWEAKR